MPTSIGREDVQRLVASGAQLVEVLPKREYDEDHLPGALHLALSKIDSQATSLLRPAKPVIVYCWDSG